MKLAQDLPLVIPKGNPNPWIKGIGETDKTAG